MYSNNYNAPMYPSNSQYYPQYGFPARHEVGRVKGKDGALVAPMAPNSSEIFLDELEPLAYLVQTDSANNRTIDTKSLTKEQWEKMLGHIPIVRCKYCYFGKQDGEIVECGLLGIRRLADDFCSDGKL